MLTDQKWESWLATELNNYKIEIDNESGLSRKKYLKKGYIHFDPKIWLPSRKEEIRNIVSNSHNITHRAFYPFLRTIVKTPRYRYNEKKESGRLNIKKGRYVMPLIWTH